MLEKMEIPTKIIKQFIKSIDVKDLVVTNLKKELVLFEKTERDLSLSFKNTSNLANALTKERATIQNEF